MTTPPARSTPSPSAIGLGDLGAVRGRLDEADPTGRLSPCGIGRVLLGRGVLEQVGDVVLDLVPDRRPRVALVGDDVVLRRGADDVKALVRGRLAAVADVVDVVLRDGHPVLHADEVVVAAASTAVRGCDVVVSVGGGTVTDVAKLASVAAGGLPHVVVQTAASVDGFSDDVSVVLRGGVKRTVPSRWPDVVLTDVATVAGAPATMNRAGLGEIMSMFTAPADWLLADVLGVDRSFHVGPTRLLDAVADGIDDWAPGLATADEGSVERLAWALVVRGIATGVAGTTACLSGVEHLISHLLDLHHSQHGLPTGLHGAQVGAASVVAAAVWELLLDRAVDGLPEPVLPSHEEARDAVHGAFGHLDADGAVAAECWRDYQAKLSRWADAGDDVASTVAGFATHSPALRALLRPSADIARQLVAGGAPARLADLDPAVDADLGRWAVRNTLLMRNRTTVVDLLDALGWWREDDVDEVLGRAEAAVRGAEAGAA